MLKKIERLTLAGRLEVKFSDTDAFTEKKFTGYGAVFGNKDHASDIIAPGAFASTLAEHKANGTAPAMFFNHDSLSMPIGTWTEVEEDDTGLKATGTFLDTAAGRDAYTAVKAGAVTGLSIGYYVTEFSMEAGVRTILAAKLVEISVVTFPCNELARVSDVKSAPEDLSDDDFLAKLVELGIHEEDAKALVSKRNKADDENVEEIERNLDDADDEELAEDATGIGTESDAIDDEEAKYITAAIEAVNNLIRDIKQEYHGR